MESSQYHPEERLVNPALVDAINKVSEHFNHTSATDKGELGVMRDTTEGSTTIILPLEATLKQLFETFKKGEGTHDSSILLLDTARLLAKQEVVQKSDKARSFVEDIYRVGYLMEYGTQPESAPPSSVSTSATQTESSSSSGSSSPPATPLTESPPLPPSLFDTISIEQLSHPEPDYEKELAFWMIGRGDPSTQGYWTRLEKRNKNKVFGGGVIVDQPLIFPDTDIMDTEKLLAQLPEVLRRNAKAQQDRLSDQDTRLPQIFPRLLSVKSLLI